MENFFSGGEQSPFVRLREALADLMQTVPENVQIFSVGDAGQPGHKDLNVWFSAHGSPYYRTEKLQGYVAANKVKVRRKPGISAVYLKSTVKVIAVLLYFSSWSRWWACPSLRWVWTTVLTPTAAALEAAAPRFPSVRLPWCSAPGTRLWFLCQPRPPPSVDAGVERSTICLVLHTPTTPASTEAPARMDLWVTGGCSLRTT